MRILFLTSRFPYPLEKGDKLRAYHQVKELSKNHDIILAAVSDRHVLPEHVDALKPFCKRIIVHHISFRKVVLNLVATFFSKIPFQVGYFYSKKFQQKITSVIEKEKPEAIYCQLVRMAEYVKGERRIPRTLDYMDAFSTGLERLARRSTGLKKIAVKWEWKRMLNYERDIFPFFDHHTIISEQDKQLIPHKDHDRIHVVPNGVDLEYYRPMDNEKKFDLIFSGNMAYPPNVESALFVAKEVMPLLLKKYPGIRMVIAGTSPAREIQRLQNEHIEVTGWVEDMRICFSQSKIHLAPMLISIGLQNKILQAMAMKIPCIVSKLANNAIQAPENLCVLIAETPEEYAEKISLLLNDPQVYNNITQQALRFVHEKFHWSAAVKKLEHVLKQKS